MRQRKKTMREEIARMTETAEALVRLRWFLKRKCKRLGLQLLWNNPGTSVTQLIEVNWETYLFIMEAGFRSALIPRLAYRTRTIGIALGVSHGEAVHAALSAERKYVNRNNVVAFVDPREPVELLWDPARFVQDLDRIPVGRSGHVPEEP